MVSLRKKCPEEISEFAELYLLQRLSEEDNCEFEEHLLGCSGCLDAVEEADQFLLAIRSAKDRIDAEVLSGAMTFRPGSAVSLSTV
jgi:hypothetical protein